jgi:hypothetical protein
MATDSASLITLTTAEGYYLNPEEAEAQKNSALASVLMADILNKNLDVWFHGQWNLWASYIERGLTPPNPEPQPPVAWTTAVQPSGYTAAVPGTEPLCALPPTPSSPLVIPPPVQGKVSVGIAVAGNPPWFTVVPGDGLKDGERTGPGTVSADGVTGDFQKRIMFIGMLYEKVG